MKYDLRSKPWIEVEYLDGTKESIGLQRLFEEAHNIRDFHHDNPLAEAALMRILIALSHRILNGPPDKKAWKAAYERGCYEKAAVEGYFEKWSNRFDLFDEKYPFMQVAGLTSSAISIQRIIHHVSSGKNATLFDHSLDNDPRSYFPNEVVYILLVAIFFRPRGRKDSLSSNICGDVNDVKSQYSCSDGYMVGKYTVFLRSRKNLFETLLLNTFNEKFIQNFFSLENTGSSNKPYWEDPKAICKGDRYPIKGYIDYLTSQSRLVRLKKTDNKDSKLFQVYICCGPALPDYITHEPFVPYDTKGNREIPLAPSEDRLMWRDSHLLFRFDKENHFILKSLAHLQTLSREMANLNCILDGYGIITNNDKTKKYIKETLPIPSALLENPSLRNEIAFAISFAEKGYKKLYGALKSFSDATEVANDMLKNTASVTYWSRLELPFKNFLHELDAPEAMARWENSVQQAANEAFERAVKPLLGHKARFLEAYILSQRKLYLEKGGKS